MPVDPDYALFARVAEAGSLSGAARMLRLSPAAVSKRLAALEARMGVHLVHRTTRRLALTAAGERFRDDLIPILAALRAAEDRATGRSDTPAGRLTVSAPTSFGRLHVAPHLGTFLARYPAIALGFDLDDGFVDLMAGRVDVAIRIAVTLPDGLTVHRLATSRRVLCAAPAYLAQHGTPESVDALARHRLLAAEGQMPWRLVAAGRELTVAAESHVRTNSSEMVRELALGGVGLALRSLWDVAGDLATGRLVRVLEPWEGSADAGIYAVHLRSPRVPPTIAAFVAFLRAVIDADRWALLPATGG
ncbi:MULTISPECIES: LysR family transcriptional regulator [unclassified Sphingomonas]|jgi:DNA-binding transcriptional LysR family regulator|uniref:LysR family transcriptional regulator n=1 Tax=unclassified Sphingomonas TaxID=196159 RepID=UPI000E10202E|nr:MULTISPECIES: LysR family transcriptional regulator [unclassified Sphingomonas]AXJ96680.1 LysR family transcriptional regulator [Sphingomonas sp. FARSPH]